AVSESHARGEVWFQRLKRGEEVAMQWAADEPGALIVAVRSERPLGAFQGAMAAVIPLTALQPDVHDPALPAEAQAALVDASGRILTATDPAAFALDDKTAIAAWAAEARGGDTTLFEARDSQGRRQV